VTRRDAAGTRNPHAPLGFGRRGAGVGLCLLALVLAGCEPGEGPHGEPARRVRDGLGREVILSREPDRIVSLAPSVTETLLALGLGNRLVGITDFCEFPPGSAQPARIGGLLNPNLEAIRALGPDLLIATTSGNDPSLEGQLHGLDLPLYVLHTPDVAGMLASLRALSEALGDPASGERLAAALEASLARTAARIAGHPAPRVLFIIWHEPLIVPGRDAFLTDAIRLAGGDSVTADAAGAHPTLSLEMLVERAPRVIFTTPENSGLVDRMVDDPAWESVPAVASGRIHVLGPAVVRPGPGVVAGIAEMATLLHPEAGKN
jgi:iron complex transport system substrate-binding protein